MKKGLSLIFCLLATNVGATNGAYSPQWLALGHYRPQFWGGYKSSIGSENFFLSEDGQKNPQKELDATIALFNSDDPKRCFFPARYKFLKAEGLVKQDFPYCADLEKFYEDLQPAGASWLFIDAYMGSPASLFGHTMLRIDTGRKGTQLLAHGANYGAFTTGEDADVLYAVRGLVGGYEAGFTVRPYYDVINTYNNVENRDIWELNLDLTPQEMDVLVAHLWEVGQTHSPYYFFTSNCSYMLTEVLDAVRPGLSLAADFPLQTIPLDTTKAVYSRPGFVKNINYRPSRQSKIVHRYNQMNEDQKQDYLQMIGKVSAEEIVLDEAQKADVVETTYQYVQYRYEAKDLPLEEYRKESFKALRMRSSIKTQGNILELAEGKSPLQAHSAMRVTAGAGVRNGEGFQEIGYRPAYHSLTDDNYGYIRGMEINFLSTILRHYDSSEKTVLQEFELLGIKSLAPMNQMFHPLSYVVEANVKREMNPRTQEEGYAANLKVGVGATYALHQNLWVYGLGNAYSSYGGFLPHDQWQGAGLSVGMLGDFGKWRFLAEAEKVVATDKFADKMKYKLEAVYSLTRNLALSGEYSYEQNYGRDLDEALLSARIYF